MIASEARQIVRLDGVGDFLRLLVVQRVVAPHHALQLGKLADHAAREVGLAEPSCALCLCGVGLQLGRDLPGERLDPPHALELVAKLAVIDDLLEQRNSLLQGLLAVLVIEEAGILQPRPHHALVAVDDVARIGELHVGDDEEFSGQLARAVEEREILLVLPHGEDEALLRHLQIHLVEFSRIDGRIFDQRGDLVEQGLVVADARVLFLRFGLELPVDLGLALTEVC